MANSEIRGLLTRNAAVAIPKPTAKVEAIFQKCNNKLIRTTGRGIEGIEQEITV